MQKIKGGMTMRKKVWVSIVLPGIAVVITGCASHRTTQNKAFNDWPKGASPAEVGRKLSYHMVPLWPITKPSVHYAPDSAWMTALKFAALTKDAELKNALIRKFDPILTPEGRSVISLQRHVDHTIFGIVPLEIYMQTGDKRYLEIGKMLADRQWENPDPSGLSGETRFWIDDMYMITILQIQAFRATKDRVYLDRAALEMVAYLDKLQQPNGLFFHGPEFPFFWGRGNGWVAGGMAELLSELPSGHPRRERIMSGYLQMMEALLKYQGADGMWHQLIDHPESYKETSCTAMFTYAFITGVRKGWLKNPAYAQAARNGWLALQNYIDTEGNVDQVCVGTGQTNSLEFYLNRPTRKGDPHGQAPLLWCAVALLR
jgi:rhamnogalacturonyl hydrolase YesR